MTQMESVSRSHGTDHGHSGASARFSAEELEALHADDRHAARIIACLLAGVFTTGLMIYTYICWQAANSEKTMNGTFVNLPELQAAHTPAAIKQRLRTGPRHSYLRDLVYGAVDGTVTTFAVVAGAAGAGLASSIVIVLGMANLLADGFSMAIGNYLATRTDQQLRENARRTEELHIASFPEGEREEIRQILANKGFEGNDLERAVAIVTSDLKRWVDTMLQEELGLTLAGPCPFKAAAATFSAFVVVGLLPLLVFLFQLATGAQVESPFLWSTLLTGVGFFTVGALRARFVAETWYRAGFETLLIGGSAAALAYVVGLLLKGLTN